MSSGQELTSATTVFNMPARKCRNPFYVALVPLGAVFVVTAFAYGLMAFQAVNGASVAKAASAPHPLYQWLRTHGDAAMLWQLAALAVLTVAAIATDRIWDRPAAGQAPSE
jgi:hypothetical protein